MPEGSDAICKAVFGFLCEGNDYLVLGDGDHKTIGNRKFIFSTWAVDKMRESGVKHVFLEMPASPMQYIIDEFIKGKITRGDFILCTSYMTGGELRERSVESAEDFAKFIEYIQSTKSEIKVHAVDVVGEMAMLQNAWDTFTQNKLEDAAEKKLSNETVGYLKGALKECIDTGKGLGYREKGDGLIGLDSVQEIMKLEYGKVIEFLNLYTNDTRLDDIIDDDKIRNERVAGDENLAARIKDIAKGEKSVVFYGAGHGSTYTGDKEGKDLDEYLGDEGKKVGRIMLVPGMKFFEQNCFGKKPYKEVPSTIILTADPNNFELCIAAPVQGQAQEGQGKVQVGIEIPITPGTELRYLIPNTGGNKEKDETKR